MLQPQRNSWVWTETEVGRPQSASGLKPWRKGLLLMLWTARCWRHTSCGLVRAVHMQWPQSKQPRLTGHSSELRRKQHKTVRLRFKQELLCDILWNLLETKRLKTVKGVAIESKKILLLPFQPQSRKLCTFFVKYEVSFLELLCLDTSWKCESKPRIGIKKKWSNWQGKCGACSRLCNFCHSH